MRVRIYDRLHHSFVRVGARGRRWAWDIGIVLLAALACATHASDLPSSGGARTSGACLAVGLGASAALLLRRRLPEVCVAAGLAAGSFAGARTPLIAAAYSVACYGGRLRHAVLAAGVGIYLTVQHVTGPADGSVIQMCHRAGIDLILPAVFGGLVRYQRAQQAALRERCAGLVDAADNVTWFALLEERTRIAFDLHDHLGHQATSLALRAGALQQVPGLPPRARQAADAVLEAARHMLGDLRKLLEALREGGPRHNPVGSRTSCAEFLGTLADKMVSAGMDVRCRVNGAPRLLSPPLEQLLQRACREAFTNIIKHAPGAAVEVCLSYRHEQVALAIRNGASAGTAPVDSSGKMGLAGLELRVTEVGGRMSAGPGPGGGFGLEVVLPTGTGREGHGQCAFA
ncbi:sensor histidine kinase [Streptomyces sp. NPDC050658]|uniref:sensor histidine kinase n=1 Tax=unclassified Streptomyces TaxID=2593676 RepID=UPI003415A2D4